MTDSAPIDTALLRRRLMIMVAVDAVCILIAIAALIGDLSYHIAWLGWVCGAAMVAAFAAQTWLVVGFARRR